MYISNRVTKTETGTYDTNMNTKSGASECTYIRGRKKIRIKEEILTCYQSRADELPHTLDKRLEQGLTN